MSARTIRSGHNTDAVVFAEARHALDGCPTVPSTVHIHVDDGIVTLTGSVQRPLERVDAENAVRPVIGTRRLMNKITVSRPPGTEGFDAPDDRG